MLMFTLPNEVVESFVLGKPETVRINGMPTELKLDWRTQQIQFVDEDGVRQARKVLIVSEEGNLSCFHCTGEDGSGQVVSPQPDGSVSIVDQHGEKISKPTPKAKAEARKRARR